MMHNSTARTNHVGDSNGFVSMRRLDAVQIPGVDRAAVASLREKVAAEPDGDALAQAIGLAGYMGHNRLYEKHSKMHPVWREPVIGGDSE